MVVWDERQPEQKQAYANFLGNHIAEHLQRRPELTVKSVGIDDDEKGLSPGIMRTCNVLVWWGHRRQAEITPQAVRPLIERIVDGTLSLIALHSAHWSTPFVEAMYERTRRDTERTLRVSGGTKAEISYIEPSKRYVAPGKGDRLTPYVDVRKFPDGTEKASVVLPNCCFPAYRPDGKPSQVRVLKPSHPIAKGIPETFELPRTEMYAEPFHVPDPDDVVFEDAGRPATGSAAAWCGRWARAASSTSGRAMKPSPSTRSNRPCKSWKTPFAGSLPDREGPRFSGIWPVAAKSPPPPRRPRGLDILM